MKLLLIYSSLYLLISCGTGKVKEPIDTSLKDTIKTTMLMNKLPKDTIVTIGNTPVWILSPEGEIKADILILPGWNFPKEKISKESDFCSKALAKGYRLILPEMMKSIYASHYYTETRNDYKNYLTLTWVTDTMITQLQKGHQIFSGKKNYLHGISTGSRGAALVHLKTGKLFTKVVLLSGDYDQTQMSDDNLMKNVYGPYEKFKERWEKEDNPTYLADQWSANVYIGHGEMDEVVPVQQSKNFAEVLNKKLPHLKVVTHFPESKHDFVFWGGETEAILNFLEK